MITSYPAAHLGLQAPGARQTLAVRRFPDCGEQILRQSAQERFVSAGVVGVEAKQEPLLRNTKFATAFLVDANL